jgi:hypothetical protein
MPVNALAATDTNIGDVRFRVKNLNLSRMRVFDILGATGRNQQRLQVSGNSNLGSRTVIELAGGSVSAQIGSSLSNDPFNNIIADARFNTTNFWRANFGNGEWDPLNEGWTEASVTVINGGSPIIMNHEDGAASGTIIVTPLIVNRTTVYRSPGVPQVIRRNLELTIDISNAEKNGNYIGPANIPVEVTADYF